MYTYIRKIHLILGLTLVFFALMYFVSGYLLIHGRWFAGPPGQQRTVTTHDLPADTPIENYSTFLQDQFNLRGKRVNQQWRTPDGALHKAYVREINNDRLQCVYVHPGQRIQAIVSADRKTVEITQADFKARGTINQLHLLSGYGGGWFYTLWAIMFDLVSLAMIVFSITGIYLWYKLTKKRTLGYIILAANYSLTIAMILYLLYAR